MYFLFLFEAMMMMMVVVVVMMICIYTVPVPSILDFTAKFGMQVSSECCVPASESKSNRCAAVIATHLAAPQSALWKQPDIAL